MSSVRVAGTIFAAGLFAAGLAGMALAETPAEQREAFMKEMGSDMKALGAIAKGEADFDAGTAAHAEDIVAHSKEVADQFPEGSGGGESRAKPEIWVNWSAFEQKAEAFRTAAPQLIPAAQSGDRAALGAALQAVGKTCGGCHDSFRKPET